jgi:hypothetical protein
LVDHGKSDTYEQVRTETVHERVLLFSLKNQKFRKNYGSELGEAKATILLKGM